MLKGVGFEILLASPPEYVNLVAEIYYDGKFVLLVSQEHGAGECDVETPGADVKESEVKRCVDARGLVRTIEAACEKLSGSV